MSEKFNIKFILILGLLSPITCFAHTVDGGGFIAGISHPVLGFDHLLAMISVGIISTQMGGKSVWIVPSTFVLVMALGATLGVLNVQFPFVEKMIVISVIALGTGIAMAKKSSLYFGMIFVAIFAAFHGHAHGTEMPYLANPWLYALGFTLGTSGIHLLGVTIGLFANKNTNYNQLLRYAGAYIGGIGIQMLIG